MRRRCLLWALTQSLDVLPNQLMKQTEESWKERSQYLGIGCLLMVFYALTRALNHSESYDSINYALFAENFPLGSAPTHETFSFMF